MFENTRLKLTVIYTGIIMVVSIFFSSFIYFGAASQMEGGFRNAQILYRAEKLGIILPKKFNNQLEKLSPELKSLPRKEIFESNLNLAKKDLQTRLIELNLLILFSSAIISYILAGKILSPIEESIEEQKRFISDASHQLKTPLTALKTNLEVNIRDKNINNQAKKVLKNNLQEINSLISLTNNLLSTFKEPNFKEIRINNTAGKAIKSIKTLASAKKIKLVFNKAPKNPSIQADSQAIEKMLAVFLENAVKYTPKKGKVSLSIKTYAKNITIEIKDNGRGISNKDLPNIFKRFYQGRNNTDGFGLGLSLAQKIIRLHNGSIKTDSKINKGTTFTIKIPLGVA